MRNTRIGDFEREARFNAAMRKLYRALVVMHIEPLDLDSEADDFRFEEAMNDTGECIREIDALSRSL